MILFSSFRFTKASRPRFAPFRLLLVLLAAGRLHAAVVPDRAAADLVLGRPAPDATRFVMPLVAVDPTTQKVFVSDGTLNRVLRFSSADSLTNGAAAEAVLGQTDFSSWEPGCAAGRMNSPTAMCCDLQGRLWVSDTGNHRVLRFDQAATLASGAAAHGVLGQVDFSSAVPNTSASTLSIPVGLAADALGNLYVADFGNHRVLRFNAAATLANGGSASAVLGHLSMSDGSDTATGPASINTPIGLAITSNPVFPTRPYLWVADSFSNRVLLFTDAPHIASGSPATRVLGQTGLADNDHVDGAAGTLVPYSIASDSNGRLWVACFNRVLRFDNAVAKANGADADGVLGQSSFNTTDGGTAPANLNYPLWIATGPNGRLWISDMMGHRVLRHDNAASKVNGAPADGVLGAASTTADLSRSFEPSGIAIDPASGKLFVADRHHHRVLRFASTAALDAGAAAEAVFGQPDLSGSQPETAAARMESPNGIAIDKFGNLWVADTGNHRVLRFNNAAQRSSGVAADGLLGQATFGQGSNQPLSRTSTINVRHLACGPDGELWVANSNRILRFDDARNKSAGAPADGILGHTSYDTNPPVVVDERHFMPWGIAVDAGGRLWVGDSSNHRALRFDHAVLKPDGAAADGVLGQSSFSSANDGGLGPDGMVLATFCPEPNGRLWVCDEARNRVLRWENAGLRPAGADADGLLGQPDFGFGDISLGADGFSSPTAVARDSAGRLWIADAGNERVMRFTPRKPRLMIVPKNASTVTVLMDRHATGAAYRIESSADLVSWNTMSAFIAPPNSPIAFDVPRASGGREFFRIVEP